MTNIVGIEPTDIEVVTEDGAPCGKKHLLIWNPAFKDPAVPSFGCNSSLSEATGLMRFLMKRGVRVILFCKVCVAAIYYVLSVIYSNQDSEGLRIGNFMPWRWII